MSNNICLLCKHYLGEGKCKAFESIPDIILSAENPHDLPLENQNNNIVFEQLK